MNYKIEAIHVLLNENCTLQRFFPLIPYKETLLQNLIQHQYYTKVDCMTLSDKELLEMGLPDAETARLFKNYLSLYDPKENKFKEIKKTATTEAEAAAFQELYLLPGVKATRAKLYFDAGYKTLRSIASTTPEQIILDTSNVIQEKNLSLITPLPKEVRTHIAVAKAFTIYAV